MIIDTREELYSYVAKKTETMQKMDTNTLELATMAIMEMASYLTEYEELIKEIIDARAGLRTIRYRRNLTMLRDDCEANFDICYGTFQSCLKQVES